MKKKLLTILLVLCMVVSVLPGVALAADFNDVDGHWGEAAIDRWAGYGVLNGKGDGSFAPDDVMTRAEFAQMLVNMMGYSKKSDQTFTDLDPNAWYADAISKLVAAGVMKGDGGGVNPLGQISREEAAVMLCRAFNIRSSGKGGMLFNDAGSVSSWAVDAMTALTEQGMINGTGNNMLSPGGIVNRATAAQLTSNMVAEYVTSNKVLTGPIDGVVIVAKGAKVEIRDAVVTSSIVAESASVTLTNTKAQNVVVGGTGASVTADKDSSVVDVSMSGSTPKVEIKGEVAGSVTVEEGATGAAATVPEDTAVANESGSSASVNGSAVASGSTATAPETPSTPSTPSRPSGGSGNKAPADSDDKQAGEADDDKRGDAEDEEGEATDPESKLPEDPGEVKAEDVTAGDKEPCEDAHKWGKAVYAKETDEPTCTKTGTATFTCSECGATTTKEVEALGHSYTTKEVTKQPTCSEYGEYTIKCANCGEEKSNPTTSETQIAKLDHDFKNGRYSYDANGHTLQCKYCDAEDENYTGDHALTYSNKTATKHTEKCDCGYTKTVDHDYGEDGPEVTKDATCSAKGSQKSACVGCGYEKIEDIPIDDDAHEWDPQTGLCKLNKNHKCGHDGVKAGEECGTCGYTVPEEEKPAEHKHKWSTEWSKDKDSHWHECEAENCPITENSKKDSYGMHDVEPSNDGGITVTKSPTCNATGAGTYTCSCGEELTTTIKIDSNAHNWNNPATPGTCANGCGSKHDCGTLESTVEKCPTCGADNPTYEIPGPIENE